MYTASFHQIMYVALCLSVRRICKSPAERVDIVPVGLMASEDKDEESVQCRERKESSKCSDSSFPNPITPAGDFACRVPSYSTGTHASSSGSYKLNIKAKLLVQALVLHSIGSYKLTSRQKSSPGIPGMVMNTKQAFCLIIDHSCCLLLW